MTVDPSRVLVEQLEFYWDVPLRPRKDSMAQLVAHISREAMHHGAEISLLRDLYRATGATARDSRLGPPALTGYSGWRCRSTIREKPSASSS
jgi:hypothetical protein